MLSAFRILLWRDQPQQRIWITCGQCTSIIVQVHDHPQCSLLDPCPCDDPAPGTLWWPRRTEGCPLAGRRGSLPTWIYINGSCALQTQSAIPTGSGCIGCFHRECGDCGNFRLLLYRRYNITTKSNIASGNCWISSGHRNHDWWGYDWPCYRQLWIFICIYVTYRGPSNQCIVRGLLYQGNRAESREGDVFHCFTYSRIAATFRAVRWYIYQDDADYISTFPFCLFHGTKWHSWHHHILSARHSPVFHPAAGWLLHQCRDSHRVPGINARGGVPCASHWSNCRHDDQLFVGCGLADTLWVCHYESPGVLWWVKSTLIYKIIENRMSCLNFACFV